MARLKIELMMDGDIIIPYSYRRGIQAFIYSTLSNEQSFELHDDRVNEIKPFVFSNIIGKYTRHEQGIAFSGNCVLYVASTEIGLLASLYEFCVNKGFLSLYGNYIPLKKISQFHYRSHSGAIDYQTISPVTVFDIAQDGKSYFYTPESDIFREKLTANLIRKYEETYGKSFKEYLNIYKIMKKKKQIVSYKGFTFEAYDLSLTLDCNERVHDLAMDLGLGNRNAIGMGMIEYAKKNVKKTV